MGTYTTNLNLYNTNMLTDGNDTFDFQRDLNDNNDKIDSAVGKLSTLSTTAQTSLVASINEVVSNCGALANLSTTDKTNLVSAINELVTSLGGKTSKSLNDLNATGQAILDKKVEVEALLAQNGYAKFSWKENNVISNLIINWGCNFVYGSNSAITIKFAQSYTAFAYPIIAVANFANEFYIATLTNDITLSGFKPVLNTSSYRTLYWFAIGY